jgi:GDP-D-mannose dehydratase
MHLSHTTTQAIITGAIGIVVVLLVRFLLGWGYDRYGARRSTSPAA